MPTTRYKTRRPKKEFISHADTQELRQYQALAGQFPPLRHSELIALSRAFVAGRDMQVALDESVIVDAVLGGDWSEENILAHKKDVQHAYAANMRWLSDSHSAADIVASFVKNTPDISSHIGDNIIASILWEEPITLASAYPPCADMTPKQLDRNRGKILAAARSAVAKVKPSDVPKDVIDRWRHCARELNSRYLLHIQQLPHGSKVSLRRAKRAVENGEKALADIVNHNLQLAMSRVGRIMRNNPRAQQIGVSDLIGAANMGLILGARQFDPERGRKFSTYAAYHIDGQLHEILNVEDGKSGIKGISPHEQKQLNTILSIKKSFESIYGRAPTITEMQSLSGISKGIVKKRLTTPQLTTQSINSPVRQGDDESIMLSEVIASTATIDHEVEAQNMIAMTEDLKEEILALSPVQRRILLGKTGICLDGGQDGAPLTAKTLGEELGISPQEVNARYQDTLENLKRKLVARGWSPDNLPFHDVDD